MSTLDEFQLLPFLLDMVYGEGDQVYEKSSPRDAVAVFVVPWCRFSPVTPSKPCSLSLSPFVIALPDLVRFAVILVPSN